jgi:kinesin family protein 11
MEETMSTLDYAHRAKNIKNQPTINQKMTKKVVLKEYCAEIESLKNMLQLTREKNGVYVDPNEFYAMEAKIATQESQLLECESALRSRNEEGNCPPLFANVLVSPLFLISNVLLTLPFTDYFCLFR